MRIAQHSVAGEAGFRPQNPEMPSGGDDQQALEEFACDRSNLPWVIFRAAHRATHTSALPARARALLAALARTVDAARPFAAIFARRELLTGRALQSMRTFYRSLDDLETAGFISRPPQTRYGNAGLFGRAYLHLTPKAAALLGLVEPASEMTPPAKEPTEAVTKASTDLPFASPSATVAHGAIYKDLNPATQKRQPGRVPADLQRLLSLGFREFLIFKLMRDAKRHGKLLSDVVEASWNHLRLASHPISYLRTLLRVPVDFAYRVRVQRAEVAQQQQQRQRAQYVETTVMHLAGASFVSRDGLRSYSISDDAKSVIIHHRDETHPRVHAGNWAREFLGALEAGHIVRVAPDTSTFDSRIVRHGIAVAAPSASVSGGDRPSESTQPRDNPLHDLRQLLRLKQARATPTNKPRDAAKHMNHERRGAFPLSTLLHVISGSASSRA